MKKSINCNHCGCEITTPWVWETLLDELKDKQYCSNECSELACKPYIEEIIKKNNLQRWNKIKSAFYMILDTIEDQELKHEFDELYPNIYETIVMFDEHMKEN